METPKRLYRSTKDRMFAGVCGGIAEYLDVDPTLVRLVFVALTFVGGGPGFVIYIVLMLIVPEQPPQKRKKKKNTLDEDDHSLDYSELPLPSGKSYSEKITPPDDLSAPPDESEN